MADYTGKEDFTLLFGDNAKTWASELEARLKPAITTIDSLQAAMNAYEASINRVVGQKGTANPVQDLLNRMERSSGTFANVGKEIAGGLTTGIDALKAMREELGQLVAGLGVARTTATGAAAKTRSRIAGQRRFEPGSSLAVDDSVLSEVFGTRKNPLKALTGGVERLNRVTATLEGNLNRSADGVINFSSALRNNLMATLRELSSVKIDLSNIVATGTGGLGGLRLAGPEGMGAGAGPVISDAIKTEVQKIRDEVNRGIPTTRVPKEKLETVQPGEAARFGRFLYQGSPAHFPSAAFQGETFEQAFARVKELRGLIGAAQGRVNEAVRGRFTTPGTPEFDPKLAGNFRGQMRQLGQLFDLMVKTGNKNANEFRQGVGVLQQVEERHASLADQPKRNILGQAQESLGLEPAGTPGDVVLTPRRPGSPQGAQGGSGSQYPHTTPFAGGITGELSNAPRAAKVIGFAKDEMDREMQDLVFQVLNQHPFSTFTKAMGKEFYDATKAVDKFILAGDQRTTIGTGALGQYPSEITPEMVEGAQKRTAFRAAFAERMKNQEALDNSVEEYLTGRTRGRSFQVGKTISTPGGFEIPRVGSNLEGIDAARKDLVKRLAQSDKDAKLIQSRTITRRTGEVLDATPAQLTRATSRQGEFKEDVRRLRSRVDDATQEAMRPFEELLKSSSDITPELAPGKDPKDIIKAFRQYQKDFHQTLDDLAGEPLNYPEELGYAKRTVPNLRDVAKRMNDAYAGIVKASGFEPFLATGPNEPHIAIPGAGNQNVRHLIGGLQKAVTEQAKTGALHLTGPQELAVAGLVPSAATSGTRGPVGEEAVQLQAKLQETTAELERYFADPQKYLAELQQLVDQKIKDLDQRVKDLGGVGSSTRERAEASPFAKTAQERANELRQQSELLGQGIFSPDKKIPGTTLTKLQEQIAAGQRPAGYDVESHLRAAVLGVQERMKPVPFTVLDVGVEHVAKALEILNQALETSATGIEESGAVAAAANAGRARDAKGRFAAGGATASDMVDLYRIQRKGSGPLAGMGVPELGIPGVNGRFFGTKEFLTEQGSAGNGFSILSELIQEAKLDLMDRGGLKTPKGEPREPTTREALQQLEVLRARVPREVADKYRLENLPPDLVNQMHTVSRTKEFLLPEEELQKAGFTTSSAADFAAAAAAPARLLDLQKELAAAQRPDRIKTTRLFRGAQGGVLPDWTEAQLQEKFSGFDRRRQADFLAEIGGGHRGLTPDSPMRDILDQFGQFKSAANFAGYRNPALPVGDPNRDTILAQDRQRQFRTPEYKGDPYAFLGEMLRTRPALTPELFSPSRVRYEQGPGLAEKFTTPKALHEQLTAAVPENLRALPEMQEAITRLSTGVQEFVRGAAGDLRRPIGEQRVAAPEGVEAVLRAMGVAPRTRGPLFRAGNAQSVGLPEGTVPEVGQELNISPSAFAAERKGASGFYRGKSSMLYRLGAGAQALPIGGVGTGYADEHLFGGKVKVTGVSTDARGRTVVDLEQVGTAIKELGTASGRTVKEIEAEIASLRAATKAGAPETVAAAGRARDAKGRYVAGGSATQDVAAANTITENKKKTAAATAKEAVAAERIATATQLRGSEDVDLLNRQISVLQRKIKGDQRVLEQDSISEKRRANGDARIAQYTDDIAALVAERKQLYDKGFVSTKSSKAKEPLPGGSGAPPRGTVPPTGKAVPEPSRGGSGPLLVEVVGFTGEASEPGRIADNTSEMVAILKQLVEKGIPTGSRTANGISQESVAGTPGRPRRISANAQTGARQYLAKVAPEAFAQLDRAPEEDAAQGFVQTLEAIRAARDATGSRVSTAVKNVADAQNITGSSRDVLHRLAADALGGGESRIKQKAQAEGASVSRAFAIGAENGATAQATGMRAAVRRLFEEGFGLKGQGSFVAQTGKLVGVFIRRSISAQLVFGFQNLTYEAFRQVTNAQAQFVRVQGALQAQHHGGQAQGLLSGFQGIASSLGQPLDAVIQSASQLVGVFHKSGDLLDATRTVQQLELISDGTLSATEGFRSLSSVAKAFGDQSSGGLQHVADVVTTIQNKLGVNVEDTLAGLSRVSSEAKDFGLSLEQSASLVGIVSKFTGQKGGAASEQLSRILAVFQTQKGQQTLLGAGVGNAKEFQSGQIGKVITELLHKYPKLTKAQQQLVDGVFGSQRQFAAWAAIVKNAGVTLDTFRGSQDSAGAAARRVASIMHTFQGEIKQLKENFILLFQTVLQLGLLNFFGLLIVSLNDVLKVFNAVGAAFNDFTGGGVLKVFKEIAGTIVGAVVAIRLFRSSMAEYQKEQIGIKAAQAGQTEADFLAANPNIKRPGARGILSRANPAARVGAQIEGAGATFSSQVIAAGKAFSAEVASGGAAVAETQAVAGAGGLAAVERGAGPAIGAEMAASLESGGAMVAGLVGTLVNPVTIGIAGLLAIGATTKAWKRLSSAADQADKALQQLANDSTAGEFSTTASQLRGAAKAQHDASHSILGRVVTFSRYGKFHDAGEEAYTRQQATFARLESERIAQQDSSLSGVSGVFGPSGRNVIDGLQTMGKEGISANTQIKALAHAMGLATKRTGLLKQALYGFPTGPGGRVAAGGGLPALGSFLGGEHSAALIGRFAAKGFNVKLPNTGSEINTGFGFHLHIPGTGGGTDTYRVVGDQQKITADTRKILAAHHDLRPGSIVSPAVQREIANKILTDLGYNPKAHDSATNQARAAINAQLKKMVFGGKGASNTGIWSGQNVKTVLTAIQTQAQNLFVNPLSPTAGIKNKERILAELQKLLAHTKRGTQAYLLVSQAIDTAKDEWIQAKIADMEKLRQAAVADAHGKVGKAKASLAGLEREVSLAARAGHINEVISLMDGASKKEAAAVQRFLDDAVKIAKHAYDLQVAQDEAFRASLGRLEATGSDFSGPSPAASKAKTRLDNAKAAAKNYADSQSRITPSDASSGSGSGGANSVSQFDINQAKLAATAAETKDPVQQIRVQIEANKQAIAHYKAQGRKGLVDYYNAVAQEAGLEQQLADAIAARVDAHTQLAIAVADAAGKTVKSSMLKVKEAEAQLHDAIQKSGANSADALAARANLVQAQAAHRDAYLQEREDQIDFDLQMNKITSSQAIASLRRLLNLKHLTVQEQRDIKLKIKGLQDQISGDGQFNFGAIKLPTVYQVRRAIGLGANGQGVGRTGVAGAGSNVSTYQHTIVHEHNVHETIEIKVDGEIKKIMRKQYGPPATSRVGTSDRKV